MPTSQPDLQTVPDGATPPVELLLVVNNHPGVMTHVCGLLARRAYNVEAILCLPDPGGLTSRVRLQLADDGRLEQMLKQLGKLEDVLDARLDETGRNTFQRLAEFVGETPRPDGARAFSSR